LFIFEELSNLRILKLKMPLSLRKKDTSGERNKDAINIKNYGGFAIAWWN